MSFRAWIAADSSIFFNIDELADPITYNGVMIPALIAIGGGAAGQDGSSSADEAVLYVRVSDVAAPTYRDTVTHLGKSWRVLDIAGGDGHVWELNIISDERPRL